MRFFCENSVEDRAKRFYRNVPSARRATIAQSVEQPPCKRQVGSSILPGGFSGSHRRDPIVANHRRDTWTVTVTVCVIEPDVAVIVTVYVPGVVRIDVATIRVDVVVPPAVSVTVVGLRVAVGYMRQRPEQAIDALRPIPPP